MAQTVYRGVERVRTRFIFTMTANTLAGLLRLLAVTTRDGASKRIPAASTDATLNQKSPKGKPLRSADFFSSMLDLSRRR